MRFTHLVAPLSLSALMLFAPGLTAPVAFGAPQAVQETKPLPVLYHWEHYPAEGKELEARALMRRMLQYMRANYQGVYEPAVYTSVFDGPGPMYYWIAEFDDLADRFATMEVVGRDEGWQALMVEQREVFDQELSTSTLLFPVGGSRGGKAAKPIRWLRRVKTRASERPLAYRHARKTVDHLNGTYKHLNAQVYSAEIQEPGLLYFFVDYASVARTAEDGTPGWESLRQELLADHAYVDLFEGAADWYEDGSEWNEEVLLQWSS